MNTIASFYAPRFDMWEGFDYGTAASILDESCKRLGLRHVCITDKGYDLPCETAGYDLPQNLMQAFLRGQQLFMQDNPGRTLFVGVDSVITRDPFQFARDCELGVTMMLPPTDCDINNGFVMVNAPDRCAPLWETALAFRPDAWGDDQQFLWRAIDSSDIKLERLWCKDHNEAPENASDMIESTVVHFRGPRKVFMRTWWDNFTRRQAA